MVGLEVGTESLVGVAEEVGLVHEALLEGFKDVSRNIGSVELSLLLLVLRKLLAHVFVQTFLFALNLTLNSVVDFLLLAMFAFNFLELGSESAKFLNLRCETVFLLLALGVDLLH